MAKIAKVIVKDTMGLDIEVSLSELVEKKIVSSYKNKDSHVIIGRYGVNKSTLKKELERSGY